MKPYKVISDYSFDYKSHIIKHQNGGKEANLYYRYKYYPKNKIPEYR